MCTDASQEVFFFWLVFGIALQLFQKQAGGGSNTELGVMPKTNWTTVQGARARSKPSKASEAGKPRRIL
jgi:hypothetical protein